MSTHPADPTRVQAAHSSPERHAVRIPGPTRPARLHPAAGLHTNAGTPSWPIRCAHCAKPSSPHARRPACAYTRLTPPFTRPRRALTARHPHFQSAPRLS